MRPQENERVYVERPYGPLNCVKNALHYAAVNPTASPWWSFALYSDDQTRQCIWWMHAFCTSPDGTILDPTVPPELGYAPPIFFGVPWGIELYTALANGPFNPDRLPSFLNRSIFPVLEQYHQRCRTDSANK